MPRTTVFIVSDDAEVIEQANAFFGPKGVSVGSYNSNQWRDGLDNAFFRQQLVAGVPALSKGTQPTENRGNVLPFPGLSTPVDTSATYTTGAADSKVATMNELESQAIENAIVQFRGNLTEAAKALGIGRATLYRKVKQYQIDPSVARKKRAA